MDTSTLITAINEVLQASSEEEIISVINRYPELLEPETLMQITAMIEQARQSGQNQTTEALQIALRNITFIGQGKADAGQNQSLPKIEPKVVWALKARRSIALRKNQLIDEAIIEAQNEPEIVSFLMAFKQRDFDKIAQITKDLISQLHQSKRDEEAFTVSLIELHPRTLLAETFDRFPIKQQSQLREIGIQACQEALQIAVTLQDKPCQAVHLSILGICLGRSRQLREAEHFCTEALEIYQELAAGEPHIFLPSVAMSLTNLGSVQSEQKKLRAAEFSFSEALAVYKNLAASEPHIFLPSVAMSLTNLGSVQSEQKKTTRCGIFFFRSFGSI